MGPNFYEKEGHMYAKGYNFKWGDYDVLIPESDPATFEVINIYYSKDAKHVWFVGLYHRGFHIMKDADPTTFVLLDGNFCRDSLHVWFNDCQLPGTFGNDFHVIKGAYAKTDSTVYKGCHKMENIDAATFVVHDSYTEDKNDIYWCDEPIHVSDKASFKPVTKDGELDHWAKDKEYVYYLGYHPRNTPIVRTHIADYDTFETVNADYARDKVQVYFHDTILVGADPTSFRELNYYYARDDKHVFYEDIIVCNFSRSFRVIDKKYITDGTYVYYEADKLEIADLATFNVMCYQGWAKDKNRVYYEKSVIQGADPMTFEMTTYGFSRDKEHVFDGPQIVEGADPETFIATGLHKGEDKYRKYELK